MTSKPPAEEPGHPTPATSPSGLEWREVIHGSHPGDQMVRIARHRSFRAGGPGVLVTRRHLAEPKTPAGRLARLLFGSPIPSSAEATERVGILQGLAIFATDNVSSSAYATEEIMRVLVLAGVGALALTMPLAVAIVGVMAIVVLSYRQVIDAYPEGGGSYVVAHENLGALAGLISAAALLTDYVLTVAVSVSAGVAALTSAFPPLYQQRVEIALGVVGLIMLVNLRGIRESGKVFSLPLYLYLFSLIGLIAYGLLRAATGTLPTYEVPPQWLTAHGQEPLTLLLVLRAFSSGSVALTGTEAVSNGVPAFTAPVVRYAQTTLVIMGSLFAFIFLGLSLLASNIGVMPDPTEAETVVSQLTRTLVGENWYYYLVQFATALLLVLAANTAFNGFPRLASILAQDRYLPRQFSFRGDRLAFTGGIVVLAVVAGALIWAYAGSVTGLIPLYTVGVFIAFTLSQAGLVRRWWRLRHAQKGWQGRLAVNGLGALATGVVALVVAIAKFTPGAWMVLVLIPILVGLMWSISRHYQHMAQASQPETPLDPMAIRVRAVVPVAGLSLPTRQAIAYAQAIAPPGQAVAVHVTDDEQSADQFRELWSWANIQLPLVIIESPYRSLIGPLLSYIDALREIHPNDTITVILPDYVPRHWWEHFIHNQTALRIKATLLFHPGVVVVSVPYHMQE